MKKWRLGAAVQALALIIGNLAASPARAADPTTAGQPEPAPSAVLSSSAQPVAINPPPGFRESCARLDWLCRASRQDIAPLDPDRLLALADDVNRHINRTVVQLSDPENYGVAEYWTLPANGQGDCEDFVLRKYKDLLDAGVPSRALSVAIVLDRNGDNHAVLILHHPSGDVVLDSLNPRMLPWGQTGYRFLAMQSELDKARWVVVATTSRDSAYLAMR